MFFAMKTQHEFDPFEVRSLSYAPMWGAGGRALGVVAALLLVCQAVRAEAAGNNSRNPHITAAQSALDDADFDKANTELQKALAQPDNSDDMLVEIYKLQGIVALYQGKQQEARKALEKLFQVRPDYEPPKGTSPKIVELFKSVREDVRAHRVKPVVLDFDPVNKLTAGGPAQVLAHITDLPEGARVRLFYRRAGSEAFSSVDFKRSSSPTPANAFAATLPAAELPVDEAPFGLEYYVEVDDAAGRRLAGRGDPLEPLNVKVKAPSSSETEIANNNTTTGATGTTGTGNNPGTEADDSHWYEHWYVWVAGGAVVVGGGVAAAYLLTRTQPGTLPVNITVQQ
jgi:tetratricopeptide (TPR) repeat protein